MAILTENKVRQLLRTTDLKKTKLLLLEPGTIITPAAKGYLAGITIRYETETLMSQQEELPADALQSVPAENISRPETGKVITGNQITWSWSISVQKLIGSLLACQTVNQKLRKENLLQDLEPLTAVLKDIQQMNFCKDYWSSYQLNAEKFNSENKKSETTYLIDMYVPSYTEGETVVSLYQLYTQARELQLAAYNQLQTYLLFDDFYCLIEGCRWVAEYVWLLMIREIEENQKGRRA